MQRSQVPNLCKALLQTKMLPAVVELVTGGGAHQFMYDPHPLLSSVSGNSDSCMLLEKKKKMISKPIPTSGRNVHWNRMRQK